MALEKLGPFRIQGTLGRGGMGTVYAGVHEVSGERAAIKVLPESLADDPRFRDRFQGEIETLKKLRHDSIVAIQGYGEQDGLLFFVMELVEGQSLDVELKAGRKFDWRETIHIAVQVCTALKHAHDSGVIHRDLKPANLLITSDGTVKLTDFGIAKLFGSSGLTMVGSMIGTPEYMSPEQAKGEGVTSRSDLYSLGCVMYALLAGRPPFSGTSFTQLIDKVRSADPPSLRAFAPQVPPEFETIIFELLRKDPAQRIGTAQSLARLLKAMEHALTAGRKPAAAVESEGPPAPLAFELTDKTQTPLRTQQIGTPGPKKHTLAEDHQPTADLSESKIHVTRIVEDDFEMAKVPLATTQKNTGPAKSAIDEPAPSSPAPRTHFTTIADEDLRRREQEQAAETSRLVRGLTITAAALVLLAIAAAFVFVSLPMSAKQHYQAALAASDAQPPTIAEEILIEQFLDRFPNHPQAPDLKHRLDEFRVRKLRFDLQSKLRNLTDHEKRFLHGLALFDEQRPDEAREVFRRIIDDLSGPSVGPTEQKLIERSNYLIRRTLPESSRSVPAPAEINDR